MANKGDTGIIETLDGEGGDNGAQDQENKKDLDTQLESGDESLNDGGTEDLENGEQAEEVEGKTDAEEQGAESDLDTKLTEFKDGLVKELENKFKPEEKAQPITEDRWLELEKEWGAPRTTIDRVTRQNVQVFDKMKEYVDSKFAGIEQEGVVARVAKENGITDFARLKPGLTEFLKDFDPKHHSNPILIKKGLVYARGLASKGDIQKIRTNGERHRQVINKIKSGTGENRGGNNGGGGRVLTQAERQAAEMMPGGEKEYLAIKNNKSRVIAV